MPCISRPDGIACPATAPLRAECDAQIVEEFSIRFFVPEVSPEIEVRLP